MLRLRKDELLAKSIKLDLMKADRSLAQGEVLSERDIADKYGVARGTARSALSRLVNEGVLWVKPSMGYIVNTKRYDGLVDELLEPESVEANSLHVSAVQSSVGEVDSIVSPQLRLPLGVRIKKVTVNYQIQYEERIFKFSRNYIFPDEVCPRLDEYSKKPKMLLVSLMQQPEFKPSHVEVHVGLRREEDNQVLIRKCLMTDRDGATVALITEDIPVAIATVIKPDWNIYKKVGGLLA